MELEVEVAVGLGAPKSPGDVPDCVAADDAELFSAGFRKLKPEGFVPSLSCAGLFPAPNMFVAPVLAPNPVELGGGPAGVVDGLPKEKGFEAFAAGVVDPNDGVDVVVGLGVPKPPKGGVGDCALASSGFFPKTNPEPELLPPPEGWPNGLPEG